MGGLFSEYIGCYLCNRLLIAYAIVWILSAIAAITKLDVVKYRG